MNRRLEMKLTRLFGAGAYGPRPSADHRRRLEADLLARFGALHPDTEGKTMARLLWRAATAAGLVLAIAGASQVPADYEAEIGKRVVVESPAPLATEDVRAMLDEIEGGADLVEVRVRATGAPEGPTLTIVELLGDTVPLADLPARIRAAVPSLADLPITVVSIERTVAGDLGDRVKHLVGMDEVPADELARLIEAELRAAAPDAEVDVEVTEDGSRREVRVEVKREVGVDAPAP